MLTRIGLHLASEGIRELSVNAYHAAESVARDLSGLGDALSSATLFPEKSLMGSGGSLAAPAKHLARYERFLLHNGDTLVHAPLAELAAAAEGERRLGALLVRPGSTQGYNPVVLRDGLLTGVSLDPDEPLQGEPATFLGVSVIHRALLERVPADRPSNLFGDLVLPMLREGWSVGTVPYEGPWIEFTNPPGYRETIVNLVRSGQTALPGGSAPLIVLDEGSAFLAAGARAAEDARLVGGVALEAGAVIEQGAHVEDSVLLEGACVEPGARLERCIVDGAATVPGDTSLRDAVVTRSQQGRIVTYPLGKGGAGP
jgi:mannose-1-phosphate guanylyltransferase